MPSTNKAVSRARASKSAFKAFECCIGRDLAAVRHIAAIHRLSRLCEGEAPSTAKGGDYVKFTIATPLTFAVTATGIVPALANCCW